MILILFSPQFQVAVTLAEQPLLILVQLHSLHLLCLFCFTHWKWHKTRNQRHRETPSSFLRGTRNIFPVSLVKALATVVEVCDGCDVGSRMIRVNTPLTLFIQRPSSVNKRQRTPDMLKPLWFGQSCWMCFRSKVLKKTRNSAFTNQFLKLVVLWQILNTSNNPAHGARTAADSGVTPKIP